jgi:hypothetical protein
MNKFVIALALFAFVGTGIASATNLGDDKNKKECSSEKKACCKSKSGAMASSDKKADAKATNESGKTEATAKAEVKKDETKK